MTVQTSASRFHLVDRPTVLPAKCMVCGNGSRPCIDFGFNFDRYGAVYICVECITEAGRVVGLISPSDITSERLKSEQSSNKYLNDNDLVAVPREFYDVATDAVRNLSDALSAAVFTTPVEDAHGESAADDADSFLDGTDSADSDESTKQSNRTSRGRRSSSISANTSTGDSAISA